MTLPEIGSNPEALREFDIHQAEAEVYKLADAAVEAGLSGRFSMVLRAVADEVSRGVMGVESTVGNRYLKKED